MHFRLVCTFRQQCTHFFGLGKLLLDFFIVSVFCNSFLGQKACVQSAVVKMVSVNILIEILGWKPE